MTELLTPTTGISTNSEDAWEERALKLPTPYLFEAATERLRLQYQHELFQEDLHFWFRQALKAGRLDTNPETANWHVLDAGCGEGWLMEEIARHYSGVSAKGFDLDASAIERATTRNRVQRNLDFFSHNILEPMLEVEPVDLVISWLLLPHVSNQAVALKNLGAMLKPGGALLMCTLPPDVFSYPHPAFNALQKVAIELGRRSGMFNYYNYQAEYLQQAGFEKWTTFNLEYAIGGASLMGQRWWQLILDTTLSLRSAIVDRFELMSSEEFDYYAESLKTASTLQQAGYCRFTLTLALKAN